MLHNRGNYRYENGPEEGCDLGAVGVQERHQAIQLPSSDFGISARAAVVTVTGTPFVSGSLVSRVKNPFAEGRIASNHDTC
ncbi:hypothetical protein WR25_19689 [Diploscapter pachys]|uniref:Uncharacterized protein n=1 Tax=Diploscapter pachys TaxID=2018661 RepID=A0A2A2JVX1_9BILA|nr:hypothetical protein WR25_19689 [Diploscapter pachys]